MKMGEIKAAMNNYLNIMGVVPLEVADWMSAIEATAYRLGYDLTDDELCELVDYFI